MSWCAAAVLLLLCTASLQGRLKGACHGAIRRRTEAQPLCLRKRADGDACCLKSWSRRVLMHFCEVTRGFFACIKLREVNADSVCMPWSPCEFGARGLFGRGGAAAGCRVVTPLRLGRRLGLSDQAQSIPTAKPRRPGAPMHGRMCHCSCIASMKQQLIHAHARRLQSGAGAFERPRAVCPAPTQRTNTADTGSGERVLVCFSGFVVVACVLLHDLPPISTLHELFFPSQLSGRYGQRSGSKRGRPLRTPHTI